MISRLQRRLGYRFSDSGLLLRALTHRSAGADNNERLEFLGDAILGCETADWLYHHVERGDEGQLSRMRAHLVKRETLAEIARELELGQILRLGPGELRSGGQNRDSILADAVEAIIAAVYLDGGMEAARALVRRLLGSRLEQAEQVLQEKDPKTRLQEFLQARRLPLPRYEVERIEGDPHRQRFTVRCSVEGLDAVAQGQGGSRRKAEQAAARAFLETLDDA
ncbi:MAG TPA: ribonuclease III [Gammaproteobacteria bacterium]|nr:ribonuclease III [Gammaproteobacteria bacterium]